MQRYIAVNWWSIDMPHADCSVHSRCGDKLVNLERQNVFWQVDHFIEGAIGI
jgi:hypothetical protein